MDFQKLKIPRVTDFWPEKVTCRLNVLPPFREGEMTEQHVFFFLFSFLKIKQIIVHYHFTYPNGNKFH